MISKFKLRVVGDGVEIVVAVDQAGQTLLDDVGLADLVKERPKSAEKLASATGTDGRSMYRLLRALASVGVFAERTDKTFESTPLSDTLQSDASEGGASGGRPKNADVMASRWLTNVSIQQRLAELRESAAAASDITRQEVVRILSEIVDQTPRERRGRCISIF